MVDTAAAAESDRLGDALVELETDGVAYGDLALTIAIHGPVRALREPGRGYSAHLRQSHDAKVIREGYGQLPRLVLEDCQGNHGGGRSDPCLSQQV